MVRMNAVKTDFVQIDPGTYPAQLFDIEEKFNELGAHFLIWKFKVIVPGQDEAVTVTSTSSFKFSTQSKARKWAEAIMHRQIDDGTEFDLDTLKNRNCTVYIVNDEQNGTVWNRVEQVIP